MDAETYRRQKAFAGEKKASMLRRMVDHDYTGRQMYMVTRNHRDRYFDSDNRQRNKSVIIIMALAIKIKDLLNKQKIESNRVEFKAGWNLTRE